LTEQVLVLQTWQKAALITGKTLFTVLIAAQLANFTWKMVAPEVLILAEPSRGSSNSQSIASSESIADWHVFGDATVQVVETPKQVNAPKTRLRLELLGVLAGTGKASSAIIAPKGGAGEYYRLGDTVQGRTKLASVHADKVILDTNGKLETLKFDEKRSRQNIKKSKDKPKEVTSSKPKTSLKDRFKKVRSASEAVDLIKGEVANDPQAVLSQMGLEPAGEGKKGYKVSNAGSMLTQVGLQPGDVILSVNGQTLGNMSDDQMLLDQVTASGQARLEIQRGNRRFVVNHSLK